MAVFGGAPVVTLGGSLLMGADAPPQGEVPLWIGEWQQQRAGGLQQQSWRYTGESNDLITDGPENSKPPFGFPEIQSVRLDLGRLP
jgi:hypothetical protein